MASHTNTPAKWSNRAVATIIACSALALSGKASAVDWSGPFTISPVSAPGAVLEATGTSDGAIVTIGKPSGATRQRWTIVPRGDSSYTIRPAANTAMAMAANAGGTANGTHIVLETDTGKPWQTWRIVRSPFGATVCLVPLHAPNRGLDDYGGGSEPGSQQDLWDLNPSDEHLQWTLTPLEGATLPSNMPRPGTIHELTLEQSRLFPGTRRTVTVFVPAQYDGSRPACVYVRQDGYNRAEKGMLETLIMTGEMPVTIGVFVTPGDVPAPIPGTLGRRNRCFEYDGMGDRYVRFLTEEVLPFVASKLGLKLSASGNDRCIAGGSSGGIAAFNAAWERPEAFTRVYANSGSFVAFRGGHEFPTIVRKTEAKPIRAYLTTGTHDMENCAGDWYLIDQEMDKALTFSGYEHIFRQIEGPHVAGWNENFVEAMRYLWKGWPTAVPTGPSAPRIRDILVPDQGWQRVTGRFRGALSPVCNSKGEVFFVDARANQVRRIGVDGKVDVLLPDAAHANGLAIGASDELYTVSLSTGKVLRFNGNARGRIYATGVRGRYAVARPEGGLYVTGPSARPDSADRIWLVGERRAAVVDTGIGHATGLACRPDRWLLSVADGVSRRVYSFQIQHDGKLINKEPFFWLHVADGDDDAGAASVCYAVEGQILVATRMGVQVCADDGPTQAILPMPDHSRVTGVCLGGSSHDMLYAFTDTDLWKRPVKLHACGAYTPWTHVNGSPL